MQNDIERERKREKEIKSPICWFTPNRFQWLRLGKDISRKTELHPGVPHGCQSSSYLSHLLLFSQVS